MRKFLNSVTKSSLSKTSSKNLSSSSGALHLRTLQRMNDISSDQSNTIVFAMPLEVLRAFEGFGKNKEN